jgi:predicted DNA-binding transcriptional regulator YafY
VLVFAPAERVRRTYPPTMAVVEPLPDGRCLVRVAAWESGSLVDFVLRLPFDLEVLEPVELRARIGAIGRRLARRHASRRLQG